MKPRCMSVKSPRRTWFGCRARVGVRVTVRVRVRVRVSRLDAPRVS